MPKKPVIPIVDDDDSVREALSALIRSMGYVAVAFGHAEELLVSPRRRSLSCGKH
jgi:FixJ family two-component response regulator